MTHGQSYLFGHGYGWQNSGFHKTCIITHENNFKNGVWQSVGAGSLTRSNEAIYSDPHVYALMTSFGIIDTVV